MELSAYDKTDELENRYWWYVGRRYVFDKVLDQYFGSNKTFLIADIGCGTGGNLSTLQKHGTVLGLDISEKALEYRRNKGYTNTHLMPESIPQTGLENETLDLITMFDVLEHIKEDERALEEYFRVLKPGGFMFLSVPAFKFLWSEIDEHLHHFRRYKKGELELKLRRAGFEIVKSSYIFFFTFIPFMLYRFIGNFQERSFHPQFRYTEFPKIMTWGYVLLSKIESMLLRFINFPFGSSVICLARKPGPKSH